MGKQTRTTLKNFYSTGKVPTQDNYADLIDSFMNLEDSDTQIIAGGISSSQLVLGSHITASGNISASGYVTASQLFGNISASYVVTPFPQDLWTDANITASGNLRIGGSASLSEITASGGISAASITATSASFSYIQGNSPITIEDPVNFTSGSVIITNDLTASGDIKVEGTIFGTVSSGTGAQTAITSTGTLTKLNVDGPTQITGSLIELVPSHIVKITGSLGVSATVDAQDYLIEGKNAIDYQAANDRIILGQNSQDLLLRGGDIILGADNSQDTHTYGNSIITGSLTLGGTTISSTAAEINNLDGIDTAEMNQLKTIGTTTITANNWTNLSSLNQTVSTTSTPTFGSIRLNPSLTTITGEYNGSTANNVNCGANLNFYLSIRELPEMLQKYAAERGWAALQNIKCTHSKVSTQSSIFINPIGDSGVISAIPIRVSDGYFFLSFENSGIGSFGGGGQDYIIRIIS
tara:strand:- start:281 stop:1681 length:1401 start_codon:yes stop_codon:yes gene_type:complete